MICSYSQLDLCRLCNWVYQYTEDNIITGTSLEQTPTALCWATPLVDMVHLSMIVFTIGIHQSIEEYALAMAWNIPC